VASKGKPFGKATANNFGGFAASNQGPFLPIREENELGDGNVQGPVV
jgi:hypothetical protein